MDEKQNALETTVDNDTDNWGNETTVKTGDTVGGKCFLVNIDQTVELTSTSALSGFGIIGETGTGVVQRVDK